MSTPLFSPSLVCAVTLPDQCGFSDVHFEFVSGLTCGQKAKLLEALVQSVAAHADQCGLTLFEHAGGVA